MVNCGVDIVEIDRVKKLVDGKSDKDLEKIFTKREIEYCKKSKTHIYEHFAARFAGKEAVFKALNEKNQKKFKWNEIEILNDSNKKPYVNVNFDGDPIKTIDISLSHTKDIAIAFVIVEKI